MSVEVAIANRLARSEIPRGSPLYDDVLAKMKGLGLNVVFFAFYAARKSSCARRVRGDIVSCPVLDLYLPFVSDVNRTGIDPHLGNWSDSWTETKRVREALNASIEQHGLSLKFASEQTFVFVRSREEIARHTIGTMCGPSLLTHMSEALPEAMVEQLFWNGDEYFAILADAEQCRRAEAWKGEASFAPVRELLRMADVQGFIENSELRVRFGSAGTGSNFLRDYCLLYAKR